MKCPHCGLEIHQDSDELFTLFWDLYPRKENKKKTHAAWKRLSKASKIKAIEDVKTRYIGVDKCYIPMATTYINGERWEDERIQPAKRLLALPKIDDELVGFAKKHNLPSPSPSEYYPQYRKRLQIYIENMELCQ